MPSLIALNVVHMLKTIKKLIENFLKTNIATNS